MALCSGLRTVALAVQELGFATTDGLFFLVLYCSCVACCNRLRRKGLALNEVVCAGVDGLFMCCHIV